MIGVWILDNLGHFIDNWKLQYSNQTDNPTDSKHS